MSHQGSRSLDTFLQRLASYLLGSKRAYRARSAGLRMRDAGSSTGATISMQMRPRAANTKSRIVALTAAKLSRGVERSPRKSHR